MKGVEEVVFLVKGYVVGGSFIGAQVVVEPIWNQWSGSDSIESKNKSNTKIYRTMLHVC